MYGLTMRERLMPGRFDIFRDGRRLGMRFVTLGDAYDYANDLALAIRQQWNEGERYPIVDLSPVNMVGHPTLSRTAYVINIIERRSCATLESIRIAG